MSLAGTARTELPNGTKVILANPTGLEPATRGLVLLTDIFGLRPVFEELCADLAAQLGAVVCCPEPFPMRDDLDSVESRLAAVRALSDERVLEDIELAAAATTFQVVDVVGFCLGGTSAYLAASMTQVERVVSFYGPLRAVEEGRTAVSSSLDDGRGEKVLAIVAGRDPLTPAELLALLQQQGVTMTRFPGADHAFVHDGSHPNHRPTDARRARRLAEGWLTA